MKKILSLALILISSLFCLQAATEQDKDPVTWTYEAKKKTDNTYDLVITATFAKPWHLYSQNSGEDGPVPTKITFNANPLITKDGKTTESGKLEKIFDKNFNTNVLYYSEKVVFTQKVKLKGKAKTVVTGKVEFMVCNDVKCLPPKTVTFSIKL